MSWFRRKPNPDQERINEIDRWCREKFIDEPAITREEARKLYPLPRIRRCRPDDSPPPFKLPHRGWYCIGRGAKHWGSTPQEAYHVWLDAVAPYKATASESRRLEQMKQQLRARWARERVAREAAKAIL